MVSVEVSNGKFSVVCEKQEMDPWKMCESKEFSSVQFIDFA